ncbi:MAG: hypothetical protein QM608_21745, partial [Caulobacter sp.]
MSVQPVGTVVPNLASVMPTATVAPAGSQGGQTGQPGLPPPAMLAQKALAEASEALGKIAAQAGAQSAPEAADTVESLLKGGATGQAREILLSSPAVQARAVSDLVGRAAPAQGGMAPLLADLEKVSTSPDAPAVVRQAAANMLALRSPIDGAVTAGEIRQAFARSGLFMEQRLAEEAEPGAAPLAAKDLKAAMLVLRAAVASWSAQARPASSAAPSVTSAPTQAAQGGPASATTVSLMPATSEQASADPVSTAQTQAATSTSQSAVAEEGAPLARPVSTSSASGQATEAEAPSAAAPQSEPEAQTPVARFLAAVAPRPAPQQAAQPAAALFVLAQEAAADFEAPVVRQPQAQPSVTPPGKGPPPPFAGGPVVAQAAAASTLADD